MKKNRMMRLASGLLVAVLATTSVISGTYAKYTTQDSGSDVARVAKWGVELQVVGNLYGETYGENNAIVGDTKNGAGVTVQSLNSAGNAVGDDVVAPGTLNAEGFTFKVNGTPEVDYKATVVVKHQNIFLNKGNYGVMVAVNDGTLTAANFNEFAGLYTFANNVYTAVDVNDTYDSSKTYFTLEDDFNLDKTYYPVVYALAGVDAGKTEYNVDSVYADNQGRDSLTAIVDAIGASVVAGSAEGNEATTTTTEEASKDNNMTRTMTYVSNVKDSNTNVAEELRLSSERLTWAWKFGNDDAVGNNAATEDKADTILGNLMAGTTKTQVVVADGEKYVNLVLGNTPAENGYLVFKATDSEYTTPVACLQTSFDIDITVTQVN